MLVKYTGNHQVSYRATFFSPWAIKRPVAPITILARKNTKHKTVLQTSSNNDNMKIRIGHCEVIVKNCMLNVVADRLASTRL
jgi:hypothetical protein